MYEKDGFTREKLAHLIEVKVTNRKSLKEYKGGECPPFDSWTGSSHACCPSLSQHSCAKQYAALECQVIPHHIFSTTVLGHQSQAQHVGSW